MSEAQFWGFLEGLWRTRGREAMMAGMVDTPNNPEIQAVNHYIMSHVLLPRDYTNIPVEAIASMGRLLLEKGIQRKTREAIMVILAHHGSEEALRALGMYNNMRPKKGLEVFAMMALDECLSWNKGGLQ